MKNFTISSLSRNNFNLDDTTLGSPDPKRRCLRSQCGLGFRLYGQHMVSATALESGENDWPTPRYAMIYAECLKPARGPFVRRDFSANPASTESNMISGWLMPSQMTLE
eukprot:6179637-Pleurochrysis_carterae.AAC.3